MNGDSTMIKTEYHPLVSAVIPTRGRPDLLCRAVRSVLNQTYSNIEVVVVVDGPDHATVQTLEALHEPRLSVIALAASVGGSEARNVGVRTGRGEWIAFLDDDDEWLPEKLDKQLESVGIAAGEVTFAASQYFDDRDGKTTVQPRLFPSSDQELSEYLFCEIDLLGRRRGFLQTSTWLVRRQFCLSYPFTSGLKKNQDTDWLLRSLPHCREQTNFVAEPLTIFHRHPTIKRISTTLDWEYTYKWAETNRHLFTSRALAFLLMTECTRSANRQGSGVTALAFLWKKASESVRHSPRLLLCLGISALHCFALSAFGKYRIAT
jgi:glycosyltransferase involved in cell wall biosynthesis